MSGPRPLLSLDLFTRGLLILVLAAALTTVGCGGAQVVDKPDAGVKSGTGEPGGGPIINRAQPEDPEELSLALEKRPPGMPWIDTASFSEDGKTMLFVTTDGQLWRWSIDTSTIRLAGSLGEAREHFELRPFGNLAVAVGGDAPRIVETANRGELMRFAPWKGATIVRWSATGTRFALARRDGAVAVWDVAEQLQGYHEGEKLEDFLKRQEPRFQVDFPGQPTALAMAPDGRLIVALDDNSTRTLGTIYVWDPSKGNKLEFLGRTNTTIKRVEVSLDSAFAAAIAEDQTLRVVSTNKSPKGFLQWSLELKARAIDWTGENHLLYHDLDGRTVAVDPVSGEERWITEQTGFERCWGVSRRIVCTDGRALTVVDAQSGKDLVIAAAWSSLYIIFTPDGMYSGDAPPQKWLRAIRGGKPARLDDDTWRKMRNPKGIANRILMGRE